MPKVEPTRLVFDITEPRDGEFWYTLLTSEATVSGRVGPNGFFEVTADVPNIESATVEWGGEPHPFIDWFNEVMGEDYRVFVELIPSEEA